MKKRIAFFLALLCLTGCAPTEPLVDRPVGEFGLWFAVAESKDPTQQSDVVVIEYRAWDDLPSAETLLEELLDGPDDPELISPFPRGVKALGVQLDTASGTLLVDLSEQYGSLSGFDLTVADYCIVMTMCQIPWVSSVRILVEGESIPYRNRQNMQDTDLFLSGIQEVPDTFMTVLFFPDRDNLCLRTEYRQVERDDVPAVEVVMTELLRGPSGTGKTSALPPDTHILGLSVSGTTCQIDLSSEFVDNAPLNGAGPQTTLYALVNTLCALGNVAQVRVMVEGVPLQSYHGTAISNPISANYDFVKD